MSTRTTLAHEKGYRIYTERHDPTRVWLQLDDDPEFRLITEQAGGGGGIGSGPFTSLTVAIPRGVWKRLVHAYARAGEKKRIRLKKKMIGLRHSRRIRLVHKRAGTA